MHSGLDNDLRHANLWGISNTMVVIKTKTDPEYLRREACRLSFFQSGVLEQMMFFVPPLKTGDLV